MNRVTHIPAVTWHGRKGAVRNAFSYSVDMVMIDAEGPLAAPLLFARNRRGVMSLWDRDHGGAPGQGRGAVWLREVLAAWGVEARGPVRLIAQPRVLGHVFNPVSFWLAHDHRQRLVAVVAEVTNTFGDRHSYLCAHADGRPILPDDELVARKILHVSPFQEIAGEYRFHFDIGSEKIAIRIEHDALIATLAGPCRPLTSRAILGAMLRRPFGSRRVLALIHWQALRLWLKGAPFRSRPTPPAHEVSR